MNSTKFIQSALLCLLVSLAGQSAQAGYSIAGVVDKSGRAVVPCVYHRIDYLGHGFFFAHQLNRVHPLRDSNKGIIFDYRGQPVPVKVPRDCSLAGVFIPEEGKDNTSSSQLPEGTVLKIAKTSGFGLCKPNGDLVLPPEFSVITAPNCGNFPVWAGVPGMDFHIQFVFNSNTGKKVEVANSRRVSPADFPHGNLLPFAEGFEGNKGGYMSREGAIVIEPKFASTRPFSAEGLAVVAIERDGKQAYINTSGKVVSPLYNKAEDFDGGFAVVVPAANNENKKSLINRKFQTVLPGPYQDLVPLTNKTYAVRKGPEDCYMVINSAAKMLYKLPNDTCYITALENGAALCTGNPDKDEMRKIRCIDNTGNVISVSTYVSTPESHFGLTNVLVKLPHNRYLVGINDINGKVVLPLQPGNLQIITPDRFFLHRQVSHFHKAIWLDSNIDAIGGTGLNRTAIFREFLQDYDLIGMTREKVIDLLGPPAEQTTHWNYWLSSAPCSAGGERMQLDFKDDKVIGWRNVVVDERTHTPGPWITTNMIFETNASNKLIEKPRALDE